METNLKSILIKSQKKKKKETNKKEKSTMTSYQKSSVLFNLLVLSRSEINKADINIKIQDHGH